MYAAVDKVPDGTVVATPLKEGEAYSVLWRRGSIEATKRTLEDETDSIRQLLERRRIESTRQDLLKKLKTEQIKESHPELLEHIEIEASPPQRREMTRDGGARRRRAQATETDGRRKPLVWFSLRPATVRERRGAPNRAASAPP